MENRQVSETMHCYALKTIMGSLKNEDVTNHCNWLNREKNRAACAARIIIHFRAVLCKTRNVK